MSTIKTKKLTIVGAGPGDPDLLTIKGLRALQSADVVLYDALVNPVLLEHAPAATHLFVGKRRGYKSYKQQEINELIVAFAETHGHVVRLKGGDPFVFGRGYEEMEFAQAYGIDCAYIPGISSSIGVPGLANIPVTHRNLSRSFWVVTATMSDGSLSPDIQLATQSDATVVVLMGLNKLPEIAAIFQQNGKSTLPAAVLQDGSLPTARKGFGTVETSSQLTENEGIQSPAVLVFGEVVGLAASFETALQTALETAFTNS